MSIGQKSLDVKGEDKQFFFEKKNQKTFAPWGTRCVQRVPQ